MASGAVPCSGFRMGMEKRITFDSEELIRRVLGVNDRNIPYVETLLGCELFVRSNEVVCLSDDPLIQSRFLLLFSRLGRLAEDQLFLNETDIFMEFQTIKNDVSPDKDSISGERDSRKSIKIHNRRAYAKGANQEHNLQLMEENKIIFAIGPAGTENVSCGRLCPQPAVQRSEAKDHPYPADRGSGESLGFLPRPGPEDQSLSASFV